MQILQVLAGYSLGRADVVRRAMSKKKHDVMERERHIFTHGLVADDGTIEVDGCIRRGVPQAVAEAIFEEMSSFASYAFNKSHAAAYALVAYQTAYLKALYPREYLCALISSLPEPSKVAEYIREAQTRGIPLLPPSVNHSFSAFLPEGDGIRFGMLAIKNIGHPTIEAIVREREKNGVYLSFENFIQRMAPLRECNRRAIESLIRAGALDGLGANRHQMLENASILLERFEAQSHRQLEGQLGLFDALEANEGFSTHEPLPSLPELPTTELLAMEKEATGLYISGHPLDTYKTVLAGLRVTPVETLLARAEENADKADGESVRLFGSLSAVRTKSTKNGSTMAYAVLEDLTADIELVLFPKTLAACTAFVQEGAVVVVSGRLSLREDQPPSVVVDRLQLAPDPQELPTVPIRTNKYGLYLRLESAADPAWEAIKVILSRDHGDRPVFVRFADSGKLVKAAGFTVAGKDRTVHALQKLLGDTNVALID